MTGKIKRLLRGEGAGIQVVDQNGDRLGAKVGAQAAAHSGAQDPHNQPVRMDRRVPVVAPVKRGVDGFRRGVAGCLSWLQALAHDVRMLPHLDEHVV